MKNRVITSDYAQGYRDAVSDLIDLAGPHPKRMGDVMLIGGMLDRRSAVDRESLKMPPLSTEGIHHAKHSTAK